MTDQSKKAVIYCRNACAEQAQSIIQIAQQETECRLYAEKNGYQVVHAFHDDSLSGLTINRPSMRLMLVTILVSMEPYTVITTSMDRLSRDVNDFSSICKIIGAMGGELVFTEDAAISGRAV